VAFRDGDDGDVDRVRPPPASGVPAPDDGASSEGCVRVAEALLPLVCRDATDDASLGVSVAEGVRPVVASTSAARVTTFGREARSARAAVDPPVAT
jgi:hypothetical protein